MNNDLNSALALFQSLFKAQKGDVYTIIERFILVGVKSKGLLSFTNEELVDLLKSTFNIEIPFSVVQKCIVTNQDVFKYTRGRYVVINPMDEEIDKIITEINEIESYKKIVRDNLISFAEQKKNNVLSEDDKNRLIQDFFDFLIDKESVDDKENRLLITQFIIKNEKDEYFQSFLNSIREGMVIYKGIRYSDSPNDTSWESNTDFFLDEEYLFSAYGMNGPFFEKCFFEFYNLVDEINRASVMKGGRNRIKLYFFAETKNDIESYFAQAIRIRRLQERYIYPKVAMDNILNSCKDDVAVEQYKTNFYRRLKELHIEEYPDEIDLKQNQDYLFECEAFETQKNNHFSPDQYAEVDDYVKIADYINILRQGKRCYPLEKCKYMFLSDGNLSNELSRFIRNFYTEKKPIVITRMGTFTELMWFKLRKGMVGANSSMTISVVNKAKTVVSGLLHDNLKKQYEAVLAMEADENDKKAYYADLRTKRYSPDDINSDTIAADVDFIDEDNYFEKYKESQMILKTQAAKAEELEKTLEQERKEKQQLEAKLNEKERQEKDEKKRKSRAAMTAARRRIAPIRFILKNMIWMTNILVFLAFAIPSWFYMDLKWVNIATVAGCLLTVLVIVNGFFAKRKNKIHLYYYKKVRSIIMQELAKLGL